MRDHGKFRCRWFGRAALALTLAVFASSVVGCDDDGERAALGSTSPTAPPSAGGEGGTRDPAPAAAFPYESRVTLLPFEVRLAKLARVLGVTPDDALLAPVRAKQLDLGGYDFAAGVKPDLTWSSSRLTMWVKLVKPICASPAMHARYDKLPEKLPELVLAAYGRRASDDDRRLVDDALGVTPLDEATRYQTVCLAVLSSLEFVAR